MLIQITGVICLHSNDDSPRCLTLSEVEARNASRDTTETWVWQ